MAHRVERKEVEYYNRVFLPIDLEDPEIVMVLTAIDDPIASSRIWKYCKKMRVAANIADVPPECDFYFGSVHRDGPLQIMVSTNGNGPKMANIVRRRIATCLPPRMGDAIVKVGALRRKLRVIAPNIEQGPKRMKWSVLPRNINAAVLTRSRMSRVCVDWSLEDICDMEEADMDALLQSYEPDQVPSLQSLRLGDAPEPETDAFDGAFGWSCVI